MKKGEGGKRKKSREAKEDERANGVKDADWFFFPLHPTSERILGEGLGG